MADPSEPDLRVRIHIRRSAATVRAWWLEFPPEYRATDPKEQPHRIVTRKRTPTELDLLTYWRGPMGRELEIPERFEIREDGWRVHVGLPLGLAQRDEFRLTTTPEGTQVDIEVYLWARTLGGRLALPAFRAYARRMYPRTWRSAARLCERAIVGGPGSTAAS